MQRISIVTLILVCFLVSCQSKKVRTEETLPTPITVQSFKKLFSSSLTDSAKWLPISDVEKRSFIRENLKWINEESINERLSSVNAVDFNGDGVKDLVFSGTGVVTYYSVISITGYSTFGTDGFILGFDVNQGKISRIYFSEVLATGGPSVDGYSIVDVSYQGFSPTFIKRLEFEQIYTIFPPAEFCDFEVESTADTIVARYSPVELDTPYNYILELPGNQLGKILKGTRAIVAGRTTDSLGSNWYFLLAKPEYKIHRYMYDEIEVSEPKRHRILWVRDIGWRTTKKNTQ